METKRITPEYFIEVYKSVNYNDIYNGNCYPINCFKDVINNTKINIFFKTIAIFKIKLK